MSRFFVDPDIAKAKTLHTDFYTDPTIFEAAKEKIFTPSWQFIGDVHTVQDAGQCQPFTLLKDYLDEPLVLTKDKDNTLHCLSNVCTHRGTIVVHEACKVTNLRCRYHGRMFKLDGSFHSMPEFKEVENFPSPDDDLSRLPLFQWGPWLFASLQQGSPAQPYLQDMIDRVGWLPVADFKYQPQLSKEYRVQAH
jgi:choline monooxygenase